MTQRDPLLVNSNKALIDRIVQEKEIQKQNRDKLIIQQGNKRFQDISNGNKKNSDAFINDINLDLNDRVNNVEKENYTSI